MATDVDSGGGAGVTVAAVWGSAVPMSMLERCVVPHALSSSSPYATTRPLIRSDWQYGAVAQGTVMTKPLPHE